MPPPPPARLPARPCPPARPHPPADVCAAATICCSLSGWPKLSPSSSILLTRRRPSSGAPAATASSSAACRPPTPRSSSCRRRSSSTSALPASASRSGGRAPAALSLAWDPRCDDGGGRGGGCCRLFAGLWPPSADLWGGCHHSPPAPYPPAHPPPATPTQLPTLQLQQELLARGRHSLRGLDAGLQCGSALQERSDFITQNCAGGGSIDAVGISSVSGGIFDLSAACERILCSVPRAPACLHACSCRPARRGGSTCPAAELPPSPLPAPSLQSAACL